MKQVDLYTHVSIKGPKRRSGAYGFVLVLETQKGDVTLTKLETVALATENQIQLKVIVDALKRLNKTCSLTIYSESDYIINAFKNEWVKKWKKSNWKNAKGEAVANIEEWKEMCNLLNAHVFKIEKQIPGQYIEWLKREVKKEKEETKHV